jgi:hypothetical protein
MPLPTTFSEYVDVLRSCIVMAFPVALIWSIWVRATR